MPQALGAQATAPGRQVIACGDGGFSMLMGDFLSVVQMKLPIKIVVFNNSVLGFVAMEMKAGGYLTDGDRTARHQFRAYRRSLRHYRYSRGKSRTRRGRALQRVFPLTARYWLLVAARRGWRSAADQTGTEAKGFSTSACCAPLLAAAAMK